MIEFTAWPKTARLSRETMVITEKIDGTNAAVGIVKLDHHLGGKLDKAIVGYVEGEPWAVYAQSRNRLITPDEDNAGFAKWVYGNADKLVQVLGPGLHFGEWWGQGIQRTYGLDHKQFSLFNTKQWTVERLHLDPDKPSIPGLNVVPVLDTYAFDPARARLILQGLEGQSVAAPGYDNPEGICIYLPLAGKVYKMTFEMDRSKWELEGQLSD